MSADPTEQAVAACVALPPAQRWPALLAAGAGHDAFCFWSEALSALVAAGDHALADRAMVEQLARLDEYSAQPDLKVLHAEALRALGRPAEALRCVKSALEDMGWHEPYQQLRDQLLGEMAR